MLTLLIPLILTFSMTPLMLSMTLMLFALLAMMFSILFNFVPSTLSIVILLVYLGSVMIMSSYVCAVVPNPVPFSNKVFIMKTIIFTSSILSIFMVSTMAPSYSLSSFYLKSSVSLFLYSFELMLFFSFIIILMLMTLYTASSFNNCYSPLRSA